MVEINKIISYILVLVIIVILSGCGLRERLLSPPDVFRLPDNSLVALCTKDDNTYKFIYKDDGVYQYFINDIEQDDESLDYLLEQAYLNGSSVENYLAVEYPNSCTFSEYQEDDDKK